MKDHTKKLWKNAVRLFFYLYIIVLSYFLFFSESFGRGNFSIEYRYNLELLVEIKRFIKYRQQVGFDVFVINILGNIIAFMPFGFLLPMIHEKYRRFFRVAFYSLFFSLVVEAIQMLSRVGIFDVDDILLNTIGGILGYLLFAICNLFYRRLQKNLRKGKKHG